MVGPTSICVVVMSTSASCLNWWNMLGRRRRMYSAGRRVAISRYTPPWGLPRQASRFDVAELYVHHVRPGKVRERVLNPGKFVRVQGDDERPHAAPCGYN